MNVTLESNILRVEGTVDDTLPPQYTPVQHEYDIGDYERTFTLAETVDREKIQAQVKNGVLRVTLPKAVPQARRIAVKAG